jgi:hypothetical protein
MRETTPPTDLQTIQAVRNRSMDVLDRLTATAFELELPKPTDALETCRAKLRENRYSVLVAGEAKRGKSTFVNGILGREVLPTDVDIATCRVFCIRQAPVEGYRLRFEDGSAKEIAAEDLPRYGSQVLVDAGASPELGQMIRWIEVDAPVHFLPKEITLLDTPGLGSLYAGHSRITRRFVPTADAVILVLHSDSPIGTEEIQFLEEILSVTRSVLFIQTMIDRYTKDDWQAIQARNQQILTEKFGDRVADCRVWPISSTNVLKAAETGDADFEHVSRIRPLAVALQTFLFRAAGWSRCAETLLHALNYHRSGAELLEARRSSLREKTSTEQATRRSGITARRNEFEKAWGPKGQQRQQLLDDVGVIAALGNQEFQQIIGPSGAVYDRYHRRVSALENLDQARRLAETLAQGVVDESTRAWEDLRSRTQRRITAKLAPFLEDIDANILVPRTEVSRQLPDSLGNPDVRSDPYGKFQTALREWRLAFSAVATGASVTALLVPSIVATTFFLPLAVLGAVGAGLAGMLRGIKLASNREMDEAKRELENHLRAVNKSVQQHFYNVSLDAESASIVADYFKTLTSSIRDYVARVAEEKSLGAQAELDRLVEEAKLDEQKRKERADQLDRQIESWAAIGSELLSISEQLNKLERARHSHGDGARAC